MRFRYLGNKDDMTAFGYDFRDGTTPDVTDAHALAKLSGNNHFEAVFQVAAGTPLAVTEQPNGEVFKERKKPGRKPKSAQP